MVGMACKSNVEGDGRIGVQVSVREVIGKFEGLPFKI